MALVGHISGSTQSNSVIGISGSVIVANRPQALFPAMPGTDVKFFVSGSSTATPSDVALFGGDLMSSGSFNLKSGTGGASQFSVSSTGMLVNTTAGANTVQIAASSGNITTAGTLTVNGASVAVNGGTISTTSSIANLFNTNATTVSIGGTATAVAIGSAAGNGSTTVNNSLIVTKDLTVNGTMTTINTTNLEVKDQVIGLGFASGTISQPNGDRGWIGSKRTGQNDTHVMNKWDDTYSEFAFASTTSSATGSFGISSYSNLHANDIQGHIVSASLGFSGSLTTLIDGRSYLVAGSNVTITSASNGQVTVSATATAPAAGSTGQVQFNNGGSFAADADFTFTAASNLLSVPNASVTALTSSNIIGAGGSMNLFNNAADTGTINIGVNGPSMAVNVGGATSNVTLGPTSGDITVDGTGGGRIFVKGADLIPYANVSLNLGSPSLRWANVYTGDLHLRNDRGDYTLIEEEDMLTIRFNKTGKRYKFVLEAVPQFDEDPTLKF